MLFNRYLDHLKSRRESGQYRQLAFEITVILIIKACLLWVLWALFFSHPIEKTERQEAVTRMLLNKSGEKF